MEIYSHAIFYEVYIYIAEKFMRVKDFIWSIHIYCWKIYESKRKVSNRIV